jgi:hypothetical protein
MRKPIAFFYFKHNDDAKRSMAAMLRALIVQLLYQDDALLEYMHRKCHSMSKFELMSLPVLQELAKECIMSQHKAWVVLDGLDDSASERITDSMESWRIIDWFQNSIMPASYSQGSRIGLLLVGQRDGRLDKQLSAHPGINLDTISAHIRDIEDYSTSRGAEIRERFSLDPSGLAKITKRLTDASKGNIRPISTSI